MDASTELRSQRVPADLARPRKVEGPQPRRPPEPRGVIALAEGIRDTARPLRERSAAI
jgi:hypothetical protein